MTRIRNWAEHRWAHRRLSDYLDGELTLRTRRRLQRHADECPACGPTLHSLIRVIHELRRLSHADRPAVAPAVISRLRAEPSSGCASLVEGRRDRRW
jgi:anti-sigma factor RsiW